MNARRSAAIGAVLFGLTAAALASGTAVHEFPRNLVILAALVAAGAGAWYAIARRGAARIAALAVGGIGFVTAVALIAADGRFEWILVAAAFALASTCARVAFGDHVRLPRAAPPRRPFLLVNPRSGGGKAERFGLMAEAEKRGIEAVEIRPGDDLAELARAAVRSGADGLAMAGGDGSQAVVAEVAAEADLPFACIPAGTRNHFALDLGVDREDVVGALDAFVDGGERRVDLAEVNGRTFVNNVSLGIYAAAVGREGYRKAKLRTLLATLSDWRRSDGAGGELRWTGPGGHAHRSAGSILVSNNSYRLGHAIGSGTRPAIDTGLLGITIAGAPPEGGPRPLQRPWREWSAPAFEVDADVPVPAGIDGEAATLDPPLRFRIRPGALRVRIARAHPSASPSARMPEGPGEAIRALLGIAAGRSR